MAGILDEERDPLDFLADFPTPLTAAQRADLAWHRSRLDYKKKQLNDLVGAFLNRRQQIERFVTEAEAKLETLLNNANNANANNASSAAAAGAAETVTAAGAKRGREEETADPRAAAESAAAPPAATPAPVAAAPAVPAPPAAAPRRKFAFGGLTSLLAGAKKDNAKDDAVRRQREDMARRAEEERTRGDIGLGRGEMDDVDGQLDQLKSRIDALAQQHSDLVSVLSDMDERESAYARAFFMTTRGCEEEAGYEVSFRPAQMTEAIRSHISAQVEAALDAYLSYRDRTDPFLIEIAEQRALRAQRVLEEEQRRQAEATNDANNAAAGGAPPVVGGAANVAPTAVSLSTIVGSDVGLGVLGVGGSSSPDAAAAGSTGPIPIAASTTAAGAGVLGAMASDNAMVQMLLAGNGLAGDLDAALMAAADEEVPPPPQFAEEEEDLDRYDY